jgi:chemotaxis protein histidine kinase CheA
MENYQQGGGKCSLCRSEGTNKTTCPLNPKSSKPNPTKHPLAHKSIGSKQVAERQAKQAAERQTKQAAERQTKQAVERQTKQVAERQAKQTVERQAKQTVERQAKQTVERQAKQIVERQTKQVVERQAKQIVERQTKQVVERQAKQVAERQAKQAAERQTKQAAERQTKQAAERQAKPLSHGPMLEGIAKRRQFLIEMHENKLKQYFKKIDDENQSRNATDDIITPIFDKPVDILIACHCMSKIGPVPPHHPVLLYDPKKGKHFPLLPNYSKFGFSSVSYLEIDPSCPAQSRQYHKWIDVPHGTQDYIWGMFCPIYQFFDKHETKLGSNSIKLWTEFLSNGWKILKPNGSFFFPLRGVPNKSKINFVIRRCSPHHKWKQQSLRTKELNFCLYSANSILIDEEYVLILTKDS